MASTLLDELPCLLAEADELMSRLGCCMALLRPLRLQTATSASSSDVFKTTSGQDGVSASWGASPDHDARAAVDLRELKQRLSVIDTDAIVRVFARHFLSAQAIPVEKLDAVLPSGDLQRSALHSLAAAVHQVMKRLHHWQQTTWEALTRFFAATNDTTGADLLTLDSHPVLTRLVLSTVAKYVKVALFWTSFTVISGLLALHDFLQYTQTAVNAPFSTRVANSNVQPALFIPLEHVDHRVSEFMLYFGTNPLLAIQRDFQQHIMDGGTALAALALSCFARYRACHNLEKLRDQGVFDLEPLVGGAYASRSVFPDLLDTADMADWVLCVVLCVPNQLHAGASKTTSEVNLPSLSSASDHTELWSFMEMIASERLVLVLHRDHAVNLHDLLFQQITSALSTASMNLTSPTSSFSGVRPSLTALKKTMGTLSKLALRTSGAYHRQRRELAVWLLQSCLQLLEHNAGLVAPAFPFVLATLAIARDEAHWVLSHALPSTSQRGRKAPLLPNHVKPKHLQRAMASFSGSERELTELLAASHRLHGFVQRHAHLLIEYYQEFLAKGDADSIAHSVQELLESKHADAESVGAMAPLLEGFLRNQRYRLDSDSTTRVGWVREWRQANAHFAAWPHNTVMCTLRERMELATRHAQYVRATRGVLANATRFSRCWWFREAVFEQGFHRTLESTDPSSSVALLEILSGIWEGEYALDELVDEHEAVQESGRMAQLLGDLQEKIAHQLEIDLLAVVRRDLELQHDRDSAPSEDLDPPESNTGSSVVRRMTRFSRASSSSAEVRQASPTTSQLLIEASVSRRSGSGNAKTARCVGQCQSEAFVAGDRCLALAHALLNHLEPHPRSRTMTKIIVTRIKACFSSFLRGLVLLPLSGSATETFALRCSLRHAAAEVQCFLSVIWRLFGGDVVGPSDCSLTLGSTLHSMLMETLSVECGSAGSLMPKDQRLLDWALGKLQPNESELQQWGLVDRLAWFYVVLVTRRCYSSSSTSLPLPVLLASVPRRSLVIPQETHTELDPYEYTSPEALQYLVALVGTRGVDAICSTVANLIVVQVQTLRSTLEAEHPALLAVDAALESPTTLAAASTQWRSLDNVAAQFVRLGTAIFLLQLLHASLDRTSNTNAWETRVASHLACESRQDAGRQSTWSRLLPAACAACFHASVWRRTTYLSSVEATDSNAHLMGLAMAKLLPCPSRSQAALRCAVTALARVSSSTSSSGLGKSKLQLQLQSATSEPSKRALLEALRLLVAHATETGRGASDGDHADPVERLELNLELGLELELERLLPHAALALHMTA